MVGRAGSRIALVEQRRLQAIELSEEELALHVVAVDVGQARAVRRQHDARAQAEVEDGASHRDLDLHRRQRRGGRRRLRRPAKAKYPATASASARRSPTARQPRCHPCSSPWWPPAPRLAGAVDDRLRPREARQRLLEHQPRVADRLQSLARALDQAALDQALDRGRRRRRQRATSPARARSPSPACRPRCRR